MISFKKAVFALGLGIGLSTAMTAWVLPGCDSCRGMDEQCMADDQTACDTFDRLHCARFGAPGAITCDVYL